jgi:uncharacterized protein YprB with RNaseH-like and TPR domain
MSESDQLRRRLSRLGRHARTIARTENGPARAGLGLLPGGIRLTTPHGEAFRFEKKFPPDFIHGNHPLWDALDFPPQLAAEVAPDSSLADLDLSNLIFIDTETTGLVGGAGTVAFLVGVGYFSDDGFRIRQYFLRSPAEEPSMLHALQGDLEAGAGFVSFNGRAFDLPLLEMRYSMALRRNWRLAEYPQLDLLYPARRLWRRQLPSCSLNAIEGGILQLARSEQDVPGELIPGIYAEYLRTGETGEIERVIYHNEIDILSMVSLMTEILRRHRADSMSELSSTEAIGIGRWHQNARRYDAAAEAFKSAVSSRHEATRIEALRHLTAQQKREGRRDEAVPGWVNWRSLAPADPTPCIELAMHYEWHEKDFREAMRWSEEALLCLTHWPDDWRRERMWSEIEHRMRRLSKKIKAGGPAE